MLIDIKARLNEAYLQELLGYAVFPDPEHLKKAITPYESHDWKLLGYEAEEQIIGLIGYSYIEKDVIEVKHIAVTPEERDKGYGRGIILELLELEKPNMIFAETDEGAVEFYRSNGFMIESLGEKYPGVERFKCSFRVEEED